MSWCILSVLQFNHNPTVTIPNDYKQYDSCASLMCKSQKLFSTPTPSPTITTSAANYEIR